MTRLKEMIKIFEKYDIINVEETYGRYNRYSFYYNIFSNNIFWMDIYLTGDIITEGIINGNINFHNYNEFLSILESLNIKLKFWDDLMTELYTI